MKGPARQISVILAHPNRASFNHAIAHEAVKALRQLGIRSDSTICSPRPLIRLLSAHEMAMDASLSGTIEAHGGSLIGDVIQYTAVGPRLWTGAPETMDIDRSSGGQPLV